MWLPTPVYERIPQFWLLLGLLFMSSGTYLGFDYELSFLYFGVGFACCVWSASIFSMRLRKRREMKDQRKLEQQQQAAERKQTANQPADDPNLGAETAA